MIRFSARDFAPNGRFLLTYEAPVDDRRSATPAIGALVVRRVADGGIEAMYDVPAVNALAIGPDSRTFVYTTGAGRAYAVLARVPH